MIEFKKKYENLILNEFKINLIGPNGCGKTKLTLEILDHLKIHYFYIRLYDLIDIPAVIEKIQDKIIQDALEAWTADDKMWDDICEKKTENIYDYSMGKKISDLFNIMVNSPEGVLRNKYIVFDDIDDPHLLMQQSYVKGKSHHKILKNFKRLISISNHFHIKIILISNFDIKNSEVVCQDTLDYDDMIALFFPRPTIIEQKEFLKKTIYQEENKDNQNVDKMGNDDDKMIVDSEQTINFFVFNELRDNETPSKMDVETKKKLASNFEETFMNITLNSFNWSIVNLNKIINSGKDIYNNVKEIKDSTQYIREIRKLIRKEIGEKLYINEKITSEASQQETLSDKMQKCTESLSRCQKLLIVSAFIAGELNPYYDSKILKSVKNTKKSHRLKRKYNNNINKEIQSFSVHRLTAIYCSLYSIVSEKKLSNADLGIEFMSDLNTLLKENLIRRVGSEINVKKGIDYDLTKKLICNVNFKFIEVLALGFDLHLDDFISNDFIY
jgi:hypothetical protein